MNIFIASLLSAVLLMPVNQAPAQDSLRIVVIKGEDAVNIIQQKTAVAPVIEVRDRNNLPVPGVAVTFTIGGPGASFGGLSTLTVTTNAAGQAAAAGLTPTVAGAVQINATALVQGQALTATITQTNVLTAAQAASAAGATGGATGGSTGATSGAAGAAGGGGGLSATTIGIVGAAVAGGAVAATQLAGAVGTRELAGNITYEMTLTFGACVRIERYTGLLALEFDSLDAEQLNARATIQDGRVDVLNANAACVNGPQTGQSNPFGMNPTTATGPKSNITFTSTETIGANTTTFNFVGTMSGETINGTLKHGLRIDNGALGITTGAATVTVTLTPH